MSNSDAADQYCLHIAYLSDWEEACRRGYYDISTQGARLAEVGFIHASTAEQLEGVANFLYADETQPLVVLVIDVAAVQASGTEIRYEDPGNGELYPHIYGQLLPEHVVQAEPAGFRQGHWWWGASARSEQ